MSPQYYYEEARDLWALAVARLAALVEAGAKPEFIRAAVKAEREAFWYWKELLQHAIEESEAPV